MFAIKIDNKRYMDVFEFNELVACIAKLSLRFETSITYDNPIVIKGDLTFLTPLAKQYYQVWIKKKCVQNLRVVNG